jgi:hypothetical protein
MGDGIQSSMISHS